MPASLLWVTGADRLPLWAVELSLALNVLCALAFLGRVFWLVAKRTRCYMRPKGLQDRLEPAVMVPVTEATASFAARKTSILGTSVVCQTEPIFAVELVPGPRLPVDLVLLLDASACTLPAERASSARVARELLLQLADGEDEGDNPSTLRVLRFGNRVEMVGQSPENRDLLLTELDFLVREGGGPPLGDAWLAAPLRQAGAMLGSEDPRAQRTRAVVVLSSCESMDREDAQLRAERLKSAGVRVLVLPPVIADGDQRSRAKASLQHWKPVDLAALASCKEDVVAQLQWIDGDTSGGAVTALLERLLKVRMHIGGAKCTMLLGAGNPQGLPGACRVVADLSREDGEPIGGNLNSTRATPVLAPWRPSNWDVLALPVALPSSPSSPNLRSPSSTFMPAAHRVLGRQVASVQTEPFVRSEFTEGRQVPMDIVLCLDSSASVGELNFGRMRNFLRRLVARFDWPETRCGVIRFASQTEVLGPLDADPWRIDSVLHGAYYKVGETLLAPALRAARETFEQNPSRPGVRRILLLATDTRPNDVAEDTLFHEAADLLSRGIELVVLAAGVEPERQSCLCGGTDATEQQVAPFPSGNWAGSRHGLHIVRASSFFALEDPQQSLEILEELLQRIVRVRRIMTRAKIRLSPSAFTELMEPFELEADEFEVSLRGTAMETLPIPWHEERNASMPQLPSLCGISAPPARYSLWEESQLRCGVDGDVQHAVARSNRLGYLQAVLEDDAPVAPAGGFCSAPCQVQRKPRPSASPPPPALVGGACSPLRQEALKELANAGYRTAEVSLE